MMLALLALAMIGAAGPLICDAGCIARAEDVRPAPKTYPDDSGLVPMPVEHEMVQRRHERLMRELERDKRRHRPRGDFWTRDEIKRYFGRGL